MPSSLVTGAVKGLLNIAERLTIRKGAVVVFEEGTPEPDDPAEGTIYFDSDDGSLKLFVNGGWVTVTTS